MAFVPRYARHLGEVARQEQPIRWPVYLLFAFAIFIGTTPQALAGLSPTITTLTLTSGGSPAATIVAGNIVTLTAAVTSGGTALTVGQVDFCDAAATYCTDIHLYGTAQLTNAGTAIIRYVPAPGVHSYKAVFHGTTTQATSSSNPTPLTVTATASYLSTAALTASGVPGNYTLTTIVTGQGGATIAPTGTMSFLDTNNANYVLGTAPLAPTIDQLTFVNSSNPPTGLGPNSVATGDFNGDGLLDIVAANQADASLSVLLGNGDGTFRLSQTANLSEANPRSVLVVDINDDGKLDLLIGSYAPTGSQSVGSLQILLGNGDGTFAVLPFMQADQPPLYIATGDFNNDGKADIVFANPQFSKLDFLFGNGDGTYVAGPQIVSGVSAGGIAVADFNGDGKPDLAVGNTNFEVNSLFVTVLLGNGDGTFKPAPNLPVANSPVAVVAADFNGDGKADLATVNFNINPGVANRSLSIIMGNGDGTFAPAVNLPVTYNYPQSIAVGDFNGDGKPDLAITYFDDFTGTVTVFLGNGDGTFSTAKDIPTAISLSGAVAIGDFNGDGRSDFAAADQSKGNVSVFLAEATSATATLTGVSVVGTGQHLIDASYPGDINFGSALSNTVSLTAQPVPTTLTLTASPANGLYQQPFTLTATVSPNFAQNHNASGTVTFYNGTNPLQIVNLATGAASLNVPTTLPVGTYTLSAVYSGDVNFLPSTGTLQYVVAPIAPVITFTVPSHTFGDPPFTVSATSNSSGAITYSVVSGPATISGATVTLTGAGTVVLQASIAATGNFAAASQNATFTVTKQSQTINFPQPSSPIFYGSSPVPLTATASSGLPITFTILSGPATISGSTITPTGIGTVVIAADQPGNTSYAPAPEATRTVIVAKSSPAMTLNATPDPVLLQNPVTITAMISSSASTPTGTVTFFDGATPLGSATLTGGVASITTSTLTLGSHSITATYSGDATFLASAIPTIINENVQDFSLTQTGTPDQTIQYGTAATYYFAVASIGGPSIPSALTLAVAGAPPGSTLTITPQTLPSGTTTANITVTIQTSDQAASHNPSHKPATTLALIALGALLLPFRRRSTLHTKCIVYLLLLAIAAATAGLTGCGNTVLLRTQDFNLTVTATSGALSHSTTATLVEQ